MTHKDEILIVGGYGVVGARLCSELRKTHGDSVVVGDRSPERTRKDKQAKLMDINDAGSINAALDGVSTVVACVRQREPHLLKAAVRRGIAYTSIEPPQVEWSMLDQFHAEAQRTGARIIHGTGLEPGIVNVLVRDAANRLGGHVDGIETALLLSLGDEFGAGSLSFIFDGITQTYTVTVDGHREQAQAFDHSKRVSYPDPIGPRRAYRMPFTDQLYYPKTLGAKTAVARISLDPPWLADLVSGLTHVGLRSLLARKNTDGPVHKLLETLRARYSGHNAYSLVVEVRGDKRMVRTTLTGQGQARTTAIGAWATTEALHLREVEKPGVWLAEQVLAPERFIERLAAHGLVPNIEGPKADSKVRGTLDPNRLAAPRA